MKTLLLIFYCIGITNIKFGQCISEKRILNNEEIENLEADDNEDDVLAEDVINNELEGGKGETDDQAETADSSNDAERVMNHEDDEEKKQLNERDGEYDSFDKYEGVFGGYGDDIRSKRVKRLEE